MQVGFGYASSVARSMVLFGQDDQPYVNEALLAARDAFRNAGNKNHADIKDSTGNTIGHLATTEADRFEVNNGNHHIQYELTPSTQEHEDRAELNVINGDRKQVIEFMKRVTNSLHNGWYDLQNN